MKKLYNLLIWTLFTFFLVSPSGVFAQEVYQAHTRVDLIPERFQVAPGETFRIGLRMRMDPEWHIYWRNPGDSGMAPRIKWTLPKGVQASEIIWPHPGRIDSPPLTSYGYEKEVVLFTDITVAQNFQGEGIPMAADVRWLSCKVDCVPGKGQLALNIPVGYPSKTNPVFSSVTAAYSQNIPYDHFSGEAQAVLEPDQIVLRFSFADFILSDVRQVEFFPFSNAMIQHAADQRPAKQENDFLLHLPLSDLFSAEMTPRLAGVLVIHTVKSTLSATLDLPLQERAAPTEISGGGAIQPRAGMTLGLSILFAFLGGIILNLLPCVLPVLSIKVLSLIEHANDKREEIWKQGVLFTLGVLVMFWILAGAILILKAVGYQVGWGFQLQHPLVLIILMVLFFLLTLHLWGLFEMGQSFVRLGARLHLKDSPYQAFFFGLMTTLCATPCTAPFMGAALGYALVQPAYIALLIFTAMGLGMALPYLILSRYPQLMAFLPKPGEWMNNLKIFFGFILLGTIGWLLWVLSLQKGAGAVIATYFFLLLVGLSVWLARMNRKKKIAVYLLIFLPVALGAWLVYTQVLSAPAVSAQTPAEAHSAIPWERFSEDKLQQGLQQGKRVFVNFTAAWCLTCQVNKQLVFDQPDVIAALNQKDLLVLKADWTNYDENITQALQRYGRNSIPLYVLHLPEAAEMDKQDVIIFPELITPEILLKEIR